MFRIHKTLDIITLFSKSSSPACQKAYNILKEASIDCCRDSKRTSLHRDQFEIEITEQLPTRDQMRSILEYIGPSKIQTVVHGAIDEADSFKKILSNPESFQRPLTVDWARGRVVVGASESEILKMIYSEK